MSLFGYCGLDCEKCPAYLVTKENNREKLEQVAKEWSKEYKSDIKPEDVICDGCTTGTGRVNAHRHECEIRQCAQEKKQPHCAACAEYGCKTITDFEAVAPEAKENLAKLRSH